MSDYRDETLVRCTGATARLGIGTLLAALLASDFCAAEMTTVSRVVAVESAAISVGGLVSYCTEYESISQREVVNRFVRRPRPSFEVRYANGKSFAADSAADFETILKKYGLKGLDGVYFRYLGESLTLWLDAGTQRPISLTINAEDARSLAEYEEAFRSAFSDRGMNWAVHRMVSKFLISVAWGFIAAWILRRWLGILGLNLSLDSRLLVSMICILLAWIAFLFFVPTCYPRLVITLGDDYSGRLLRSDMLWLAAAVGIPAIIGELLGRPSLPMRRQTKSGGA